MVGEITFEIKDLDGSVLGLIEKDDVEQAIVAVSTGEHYHIDLLGSAESVGDMIEAIFISFFRRLQTDAKVPTDMLPTIGRMMLVDVLDYVMGPEGEELEPINGYEA